MYDADSSVRDPFGVVAGDEQNPYGDRTRALLQLHDGSMPESIQKLDAHIVNAVCSQIAAGKAWRDHIAVAACSPHEIYLRGRSHVAQVALACRCVMTFWRPPQM